MNIIDEIIRFFMSLIKQRQHQIESRAKAKLMSAQARAKGKAASKFNKAVDGTIDKGRKVVPKRKK